MQRFDSIPGLRTWLSGIQVEAHESVGRFRRGGWVRYEQRFKEAENAILQAIEAVTEAIAVARGGRREHVQALDRSRTALEEAVRRLRDARPREVW